MKSLTGLAKSSTDPVDPELYLWCHGVYHAAAELSMPVENPEARALIQHDGKTFALSDIPINRGMLAVMKELRERGLTEEQKMAVTCRLMHFGEVLKKKRLQPFIKKGEQPGDLLVSEALIKACATAKVVATKKSFRFDEADVAKIAQEITDAEEREAKQEGTR